jgi:hypothetical protein
MMKPGQLTYRGRRVNPATFKVRRKDLRRLVGMCHCGRTLRGLAAIPMIDLHISDINHDPTPRVQCGECRYKSAQDI